MYSTILHVYSAHNNVKRSFARGKAFKSSFVGIDPNNCVEILVSYIFEKQGARDLTLYTFPFQDVLKYVKRGWQTFYLNHKLTDFSLKSITKFSQSTRRNVETQVVEQSNSLHQKIYNIRAICKCGWSAIKLCKSQICRFADINIFFYICGPSANVALCGFEICGPNFFIYLRTYNSANPQVRK